MPSTRTILSNVGDVTIPRRRFLLRTVSGAAAGALVAACTPASAKHPAKNPARTDSGRVSPPAVSADDTDHPRSHPKPSAPSSASVEISHGDRSVPKVALTFHGAGDPATAEALLRAAEQAGVHLTVLAVGTWLTQNPTMADRIRHGGHELGNHTLHHLSMRELDRTQAYDEIDGCATVLQRLTGNVGTWFRASGTQHTTPLIRAAAARVGYHACLSYDVDTLDYLDPGQAAVVRNGVRNAKPGSILSLHMGYPGTVQALPGLLAGLHAKGLEPVTVSALLG